MQNREAFKTALGQRLRRIRGERTQQEFAQLLGTLPVRLSEYERGVTEPRAEFLKRFAQITGCRSDWLLTGDGDPYEKVDLVVEQNERYGAIQIPLVSNISADPFGSTA